MGTVEERAYYSQRKNYKNWVKRTKAGSIEELLKVFQKDLEELASHHYNWIHQVKEFRHLKENVQNNEMVLHIDFSENYACKLNSEFKPFTLEATGNKQRYTQGWPMVWVGHRAMQLYHSL